MDKQDHTADPSLDGDRLTKRNVSRLVNDSYFLELLGEAMEEFEDDDEALDTAVEKYFGSFGEIA